MLSRIFPKQFDNNYRGNKLAILLLAPIVLFKLTMGATAAGLNPWVSTRSVATDADGFRLDTFGEEAASIVVFLFASWGLGLLVLCSLGVVVLVRYRAMIPLMYLLLSIEQFGRMAIQLASPIVKAVETGQHSLGFFVNWGFTAALVIGLLLSLAASRKNERASIA
ncbi:MAG: hypothetical protein GC190_11725 [Alphaproteobacteria bacterium]|nr:hypothetical protein [Alphaproteobacteria bacterium]